jgi:histidinol dehydrogenase
LRIISTKDKGFEKEFERRLARRQVRAGQVETSVRRVINSVRKEGDRGLLKSIARFDGLKLKAKGLEVPRAQWDRALKSLAPSERRALSKAADRIRNFHRKADPRGYFLVSEGVLSASRYLPLERVGVYVPGGRYGYPSTVFMSVIPAKVAGVEEIIVATPRKKDGVNRYVLAAAKIAGADRLFGIGGVQAVAALAFGTETVPRVDKIVGPGNIFVATAKRLVFGETGIDSIAGPSEVLIVSDGRGRAEVIAAELLAQAEHDEDAVAVLISTSEAELLRVDQLIQAESRASGPGSTAARSWKLNGALILASNLKEALALSNRWAPEHLVLAVQDPEKHLRSVRRAGAIFLGLGSAVAFGDYLAGPSHILPTGGSARFLSPLGVEDFYQRASVIKVAEKGMKKLGPTVIKLARLEGLKWHARAVELRMKS